MTSWRISVYRNKKKLILEILSAKIITKKQKIKWDERLEVGNKNNLLKSQTMLVDSNVTHSLHRCEFTIHIGY